MTEYIVAEYIFEIFFLSLKLIKKIPKSFLKKRFQIKSIEDPLPNTPLCSTPRPDSFDLPAESDEGDFQY